MFNDLLGEKLNFVNKVIGLLMPIDKYINHSICIKYRTYLAII